MTTPRLTVRQKILLALREKGPMTQVQLREATGVPKKTLSSKLWELGTQGRAVRSENPDDPTAGLWALGAEPQGAPEGVDPLTGEVLEDGPLGGEQPTPPAHQPGPQARAVREEIVDKVSSPISTDRERFEGLLHSAGVKGTGPVEVMTEMFFNGDVRDLRHLHKVLDAARGYTNPNIRRLIMEFWADYIKSELPPELATDFELTSGEDGEPQAQSPEAVRIDGDMGYKVELVRDRYVVRPGGPLRSYEAALRYAVHLNSSVAAPEDDGDGGRKGKNELLDMIVALKELGVLGEKKGDDEVAALRRELEEMRNQQQEDRFARLEGLIGQLASQPREDPIETYMRMKGQVEAVFPQAPVNPDASPTVAILQDASAKISHSMDRAAGLIERLALSNGFKPEPGDPAQNDERAAALLSRLEPQNGEGGRQQQLKRKLFGG